MRIKEYQNRIEAQREVLSIINSTYPHYEQLFGLSSKAIGRWESSNQFNLNDSLVDKIYEISGKLFFLATKSQEPISGDYQKISDEVYLLIGQLHGLTNFEQTPD